MNKLLIIFIVLLTGCTTTSQMSPENIGVTIKQTLSIPAGSTHLVFNAGTLTKGSRYQPYCRLDIKAPLEGEKQIQAGQYTGSRLRQRLVRDDLIEQPAFFNYSFFGFLDEENVFNLFSMDLNGAQNEPIRLRCYQEFQGRFAAHPFLLHDVNAIVQPFLSLSIPQ